MAVGIRIRGLVQGVGFRPTVWHVARQMALAGDVRNDGDGVWIRLAGCDRASAEAFCARLREQLPPLARIDAIDYSELDDYHASGFAIAASDATTPLTGIVPDAATCPACLAEVFDPGNRRHRYPFTNCTHCGPRLSIVRAIPYDRANTSMQGFPMCPRCQAEYSDPADRRYHAQPNACPDCGPRIWIDAAPDSDALTHARQALRDGGILALKGIGGFHLACDAHNDAAVQRLRQRKRRYAKPFALMARDLATIRRYVSLDAEAEQLLGAPAAPILLLPRRSDAPPLPQAVAPEHRTLGFMLPHSPLHHLLLADWDTPLVMTSGNLSDEPQCIDNEQALARLRDIADCLLLHDRPIVNRVDDSVLRVMAGRPRFYRRARGYAPAPLLLHPAFADCPPVLAFGGELKNTLCLLDRGRATLSQHLGDLEDAATSDQYEHTLALYRRLFAFQPQRLAADLHPDYRSTRCAQRLAHDEAIPLQQVQHHHAHIAAVLAEHGLPPDTPAVLGIALDGLGYGEDGTLWGGEFLHCDFRHSRRLAHLKPVAMPGGTQAILEPWRNLWAQLKTHGLLDGIMQSHADLPIVQYLQTKPLEVLDNMLARGLNSPLSSSAGRLFDAVAAALCVHHERVYQEGQAAIVLEQLADAAAAEAHPGYPLTVVEGEGAIQLDSASLWPALFADLHTGIAVENIAARFHHGLADAVSGLAIRLAQRHGLQKVALSGGVFQNRILLERCIEHLQQAGLQVLHHEQVPSNDGCLSLGQAAVAAARALQP